MPRSDRLSGRCQSQVNSKHRRRTGKRGRVGPHTHKRPVPTGRPGGPTQAAGTTVSRRRTGDSCKRSWSEGAADCRSPSLWGRHSSEMPFPGHTRHAAGNGPSNTQTGIACLYARVWGAHVCTRVHCSLQRLTSDTLGLLSKRGSANQKSAKIIT